MTLAALIASICITNGLRYADCVVVEFAADVPPPYLVGIYDSAEAQFYAGPVSRGRPIRYRVVDEPRACLAVDTRRLPCGVFVQVLPAAWTNAPGFREMTAEELAAQRRWWLEERVSGHDPAHAVRVGGEWSAWPEVEGCSQEVPLMPMLRSLSAGGGARLGLDWAGRRRYIAGTNAAPGRIYWEGVP